MEGCCQSYYRCGARNSSRFSPGELLKREPLELVDELHGPAERDQVPAGDLVDLDPEPFPHDPPLEREREEAVVAALDEAGRHVGPGPERPGLLERGPDCGGSSASAAAFTSAGTSWKNASSTSTSPTSSFHPVAVPHSLPVSPGRGTIALTRISSSTGTRSQTSGAVNPPIDCATSTIGPPVADRLDDDVGVLGEPRALVGRGQVDRDRLPTAPLELGDDAVPVPRRPRRRPGPERMSCPCPYEAARAASAGDGGTPPPPPPPPGRAPRRRGGGGAAPPVPNDGIVRVSRETSGRRGKTVTVVRGIPPRDLDAVASDLKRQCGSGGAAKDGVVEIQGDHRPKVVARLEAQGYRVKLAGG